MSIETLKQALEYLRDNQHHIADNERHTYVMEYNAFIEKLEQAACQAIAEAEKQEPVAKVCHELEGHIGWNPSLTELPDEGVPLYTHPQPKAEQVSQASLLGAIARGWCYEENANKTIDTELALAIAKEVSALFSIKGEDNV